MDAARIKLRYKDRDTLFKKEYSELKIKVALNWFEIFVLMAISFFVSLKIASSLKWGNMVPPVIISIISALIITFLFSYFRKYQLNITRFDKEDIYKKISDDLIDKKKCV